MNVWRYELEPVDGGTLVRETWDISREASRFLLRYAMGSRTRQDMAKRAIGLTCQIATARENADG